MAYILRNLRRTVVFVPDAALRLAPGETVTVRALTPQVRGVLAAGVLEVVAPPPALRPPAQPTPVRQTVRRGGRRASAPPAVTEAADDAQ